MHHTYHNVVLSLVQFVRSIQPYVLYQYKEIVDLHREKLHRVLDQAEKNHDQVESGSQNKLDELIISIPYIFLISPEINYGEPEKK